MLAATKVVAEAMSSERFGANKRFFLKGYLSGDDAEWLRGITSATMVVAGRRGLLTPAS
ncbi:hypothetical protein N9298_01260 [bacterium]|nr:hypothetical protein [bacterium]